MAKNKCFSIVDLGGASTELIKVTPNPFQLDSSISLSVGSVRGQEWIDDNVFEKKLSQLIENENLCEYKCDRAVFVAGTMTTIAGMIKEITKFKASDINGQVIPKAKFQQFVERVSQLSPAQILERYPLAGKRSYTISSGARIIMRLLDVLNIQELEISTLGLRHGTLIEGVINERFSN